MRLPDLMLGAPIGLTLYDIGVPAYENPWFEEESNETSTPPFLFV
jgi:hypothetical protein